MAYYVIVALQIYCVYHSIKNHKPYWWILLIIFVPVIGCAVYVMSELINPSQIREVSGGLSQMINPSGRIKELEEQLEFSDTFENRVALADAYAGINRHEDAIELYEKASTGVFQDNEYLVLQLINAYFEVENYSGVVEKSQLVLLSKNFASSNQNLLYAISLDRLNKLKEAEAVLRTMDNPYSNYEQRLYLARFLKQQDRRVEALEVLNEIINESQHLDRDQLKRDKEYIQAAFKEKEENL